MSRASARLVNPSDLVGVAEIAVRTGVTSTAVANWSARPNDFPAPVRTLICGPIWAWPAVADWLTKHDMPHPSYATRPVVLPPEQAASVVALARSASFDQLPEIARSCGITGRYLQQLLQADQMGEDLGWFTKQRRAGAAV